MREDSWLQMANQSAFTNPQLFFQDDYIIRTQGSLLLRYRIFFLFFVELCMCNFANYQTHNCKRSQRDIIKIRYR